MARDGRGWKGGGGNGDIHGGIMEQGQIALDSSKPRTTSRLWCHCWRRDCCWDEGSATVGKYKTCQKIGATQKRWKERHPCIMRVAKFAEPWRCVDFIGPDHGR